jgi:HD-like signal output (HDOD) protein
MLNEIKNLPPLPNSVMKIQELCSEREVDISKLIEVIEKDPMLSVNILKLVNSPMYGMSKEITSVRQALTLFGVAMVRGFAVSSSIKKAITVDFSPYGIGLEELGDASTMQLALVREWYSRVDKSLVQSLMQGAFLMELGKLIVLIKLADTSAGIAFSEELAEGKNISQLEMQYVGMNSYELAAMMFEHWNFDQVLTKTLRALDDPYGQTDEKIQLMAKVLHVVKEAVCVTQTFSEEGLQRAHMAIANFHLDQKSFDEAVMAVRANMQD